MRKALFLIAFLFAAFQLVAKQVDVKIAQATAQRFMQVQSSTRLTAANSIHCIRLVHTEVNTDSDNQPVYYVFNSEAGFIIISGDDRAREVLAYGDEPIDMNRIPDNMAFWLSIYKQNIEYLQSHSDAIVENSKDKSRKVSKTSIMQDVRPLLTSRWSQDAPFNNQCPNFIFLNNLQCLTGCGATAVASVFHHWKYPIEPTPTIDGYRYSFSYDGTNYPIRIPQLPSVTFDWDNMLDDYPDNGYTSEQADAVAQLMRYVGQSEQMQYTPIGGLAFEDGIFNAFKTFGYDERAELVVKATTDSHGYEEQLINDEDWAFMLQTELLECRPVVYLACRPIYDQGIIRLISGHAFNVDGYDAASDTYHVNWGWRGEANGYFALNAFEGNTHLYNLGQSMIIGIEPPVTSPTIKVPPHVGIECYVNEQASTTFNVNGRLLTGDVTLRLNDADGVFALDATSISSEEAMKGKTVTVTYSPEVTGSHTATVVLSSAGARDTTLTLHGTSKLTVSTPVLLPPDSAYITLTQFRADWTDNTVPENVLSYSLEVSTSPSVMLLDAADFSGYPDIVGNQVSHAEQYIPQGWIYDGGGLWLDGGCIEMSPGSTLTTGNLDVSHHHKVTVVITAKNWSEYIKANLTVSSSAASKQHTLSNNYREITTVLDCADSENIILTASYYAMIQKIEIYAGELETPRLRNAVEEGDARYRLITGITDKHYTVEGLPPGYMFFYKVKAVYADGSESPWSMARIVTLFDKNHLYQTGDVNHDSSVDIGDVAALTDFLLGYNNDVCPICSDLDHDGIPSVSDLTDLIDLLLSKNTNM